MVAKIAVLAGDGIGPEIMAQSCRLLDVLRSDFGCALEYETAPIGGAAYDLAKDPLPETSLRLCQQADAVLLGAVGAPQYDSLPRAQRPEQGLLRLRAEMGLFCNLRPAKFFAAMRDATPLRSDRVASLDLLIVRELIGGLYFGQPRGVEEQNGQRRAFNTMVYSEAEIARIAHCAFALAAQRQGRLCSVDKANVLEVSGLWRETVQGLSADYPTVTLEHLYVDNAAMQLVLAPGQFDVLVSGNLFGDILSDIAGAVTGSIGLLPSASLAADSRGLYEPVHGSAPDISGQDKANPLAALLSLAMLLRHSLQQENLAQSLETAVEKTLESGVYTADLALKKGQLVGTRAMADAVINTLRKMA